MSGQIIRPAQDVKSHDKLLVWLNAHPPELALAIATRVSLRAVPGLYQVRGWRFRLGSNGDPQTTVLATFTANAMALNVVKYSAVMDSHRSAMLSCIRAVAAAAKLVQNGIVSPSLDSAVKSAEALASALVVTGASRIAFAVESVLAAAKTGVASAEMWDEIQYDCDLLNNGFPSSSLSQIPLWRAKQSSWFSSMLGNFKHSLDYFGGDWEVWTRWYDAVLEGRTTPGGEKLDIFRVLLNSQDDRKKGAAHVNALIAAKEREIALEDSVRMGQILKSAERGGIRFRMIAGMIRAVTRVLPDAGERDGKRITKQLPDIVGRAQALAARLGNLTTPDDAFVQSVNMIHTYLDSIGADYDPFTLFGHSLELRNQIGVVAERIKDSNTNYGPGKEQVASARTIASLADMLVLATEEGQQLFADADLAAVDAAVELILAEAEQKLFAIIESARGVFDPESLMILQRLRDIGPNFEFPIRLQHFRSNTLRNTLLTLGVLGFAGFAASAYLSSLAAGGAVFFLLDQLTGGAITQSAPGQVIHEKVRAAIDRYTLETLLPHEEEIRKIANNRPSWNLLLDVLDRLKEAAKKE